MLIYFELTHPGFLIPGVVGGVGLILSLIGLNTFTVMWGAVALILFGLILFIAEAFVPSFGILGLGGLISFLIGSLYLFDPVQSGGYVLPLSLIFSVSFFMGLLMFGLAFLAFKTFRMKRLPPGADALIGEKGEVTEVTENQRGWLFLHGENWKFFSVDKLDVGDKVEVLSTDSMVLKVRKISSEK